MSNKSFYSLLLSGKLGLGLVSGLTFSPAKANSLQDCQTAQTPQIRLLSHSEGVSEKLDSGISEITLEVPGTNCLCYSLPDRINLILSGLKPGDEVVVGIGTILDDPALLSMTQKKVRIGGNIAIVSRFSIYPNESNACYILPLLLSPELSNWVGEDFYLQVVAFRNGRNFDWSAAVSSNPVKISITTRDCSPGDCSPYGGGGY